MLRRNKCAYIDKLKCNTYVVSIDIHTLTWHSKSSVPVLYIKYPLLTSLIF